MLSRFTCAHGDVMSSRVQSSQYPGVECARNTLNFIIDNEVITDSVKDNMTTIQAVRWVIDEIRRSETDLFYIETLSNLTIAVNNTLSSLEKILVSSRLQPEESSLYVSLCQIENLEERYFRDFTFLEQIENLISKSERKYLRCRRNSNPEV
ncbi:hypothetical protein CHS0354_015887 [Potamilus streckersoni]|uniref:Uncharacterized protein n=1 Tax=Potamilus streckersoni TaxID=2493646 RepID=A0AAE0VUP1_9BIVA|nr:hypothetical protein CHS0354_015887 [Potamilus streckersoni]